MNFSQAAQPRVSTTPLAVLCTAGMILVSASACSRDRWTSNEFTDAFTIISDMASANRLADESNLEKIVIIFDYHIEQKTSTSESNEYSDQPVLKLVVADITPSKTNDPFAYTYNNLAFGIQSTSTEYILDSAEAVAVFSSVANRDPQVMEFLVANGFAETTSHPSGFRWLRRP